MAQIGLFSSLIFLILSICFSLIFKKQIWKSLFLSSVITLGLFMPFTLLILILGCIITYYCGNTIQSEKSWKVVGTTILLLSLVIYKLVENWGSLLQVTRINFFDFEISWEVLGLSFFVFNAISYLIDIKKGFVKPADSFFKLLAYLLYFPTLMSGPLHRFKYINGQFAQASISQKSFTNGLRLILWGSFKNFVVAHRLNQLFISLKDSETAGWWTILIGMVFFFYIYFSFSSFVDFFQGVSEIFNVRLKDNFQKRVYFSSNRHEFWKGWHITLNEWFRDYFFYWQIKFRFWRDKPYLLLLFSYLLIGLWHGMNWQYFIWGGINGMWILFEKLLIKNNVKVKFSFRYFLGVGYHILLSSLVALIFTFKDLNELMERFLLDDFFPIDVFLLYKRNIFIILLSFIVVDLIHLDAKNLRMDMYFESLAPLRRRILYLFIISSIVLFGLFYGGLDNYYLRF